MIAGKVLLVADPEQLAVPDETRLMRVKRDSGVEALDWRPAPEGHRSRSARRTKAPLLTTPRGLIGRCRAVAARAHEAASCAQESERHESQAHQKTDQRKDPPEAEEEWSAHTDLLFQMCTRSRAAKGYEQNDVSMVLGSSWLTQSIPQRESTRVAYP